jgi:hypothetical protein
VNEKLQRVWDSLMRGICIRSREEFIFKTLELCGKKDIRTHGKDIRDSRKISILFVFRFRAHISKLFGSNIYEKTVTL